MSKRDPKGYYPIPDLGENVRFVSVTTVLGILRKYWLEQWKVDIGVDYLYENTIEPYVEGQITTDQFLEIDFQKMRDDAKKESQAVSCEAKAFGSRLHAALDLYHKTGAWPIEADLHEPFKKAIEKEAEIGLEVIESETMVYSRTYHYAGQKDLKASVLKLSANDETVYSRRLVGLFDYKTFNGKDGKKATVYPEWKQQMGAYVFADEEMNPKKPMLDFGTIHAINRETAEITPFVFKRTDLIQPTNEFIALVNYFNICRRGK
jgi:hypothetical protein